MTIKSLAKTVGIWLLIMMASVMLLRPLQYSDFMERHNSLSCDYWTVTPTCDTTKSVASGDYTADTRDCLHLKVACQSLEDESSIARILAIWYFISWLIIIILILLYKKRSKKNE